MSEEKKLTNQLNWCIQSKKALGNFYYACEQSSRDIQRAYMTLQGSNFEEYNKELAELFFQFQKVANELNTEIAEFHLPYLQKQIDTLSSSI